jgi:hypothetical protein
MVMRHYSGGIGHLNQASTTHMHASLDDELEQVEHNHQVTEEEAAEEPDDNSAETDIQQIDRDLMEMHERVER